MPDSSATSPRGPRPAEGVGGRRVGAACTDSDSDGRGVGGTRRHAWLSIFQVALWRYGMRTIDACSAGSRRRPSCAPWRPVGKSSSRAESCCSIWRGPGPCPGLSLCAHTLPWPVVHSGKVRVVAVCARARTLSDGPSLLKLLRCGDRSRRADGAPSAHLAAAIAMARSGPATAATPSSETTLPEPGPYLLAQPH
jgi:hypothetical protein